MVGWFIYIILYLNTERKKERTLSTYTLWTTLSFNYTFFFLYKVCLYCKSGSSHTRIVSQWLCFFSAFLQNPLNRNRFKIKHSTVAMRCLIRWSVLLLHCNWKNLNTVIWVETSAWFWLEIYMMFMRLYMITHTLIYFVYAIFIFQ